MANEELLPRSQVLRDALDKARPAEPVQPMLSVAQACAHLGISKWTLYRVMQAGQLSSVKIGSRRLIPMRSIVEYIRKLEEESEIRP